MKTRRQAILEAGAAWAGFSALCATSSARAQQPGWPTQPVKLILSSAAGASGDVFGRLLATELTKSLPQPVYVENVPGAAGKLAAMRALTARDGHTLLLSNTSGFSLPSIVDKKPAYDMFKDFKPVAQLNAVPLYLIVSAQLPVRTVQELVAYARQNPGKLNYGSVGPGSAQTFAAEKFKVTTGIEMTNIAYKGEPPILLDLEAGVVQVYFAGAVKQHVGNPKLRVIAVASKERWPAMPDIPTLEEQGVSSMEFLAWNGVFAPAAMPANIIARLNTAINAASNTQSAKDWLIFHGYRAVSGPPAVLGNRIKTDYEIYHGMLERGEVKIED